MKRVQIFVKVFPVRALGIGYIKDILGPINHIKLVATAGVTPDNLQDYLDLGFSGAGISGYLTDKRLIDTGDFCDDYQTCLGNDEHCKRKIMSQTSPIDKGDSVFKK